MKKVNLSTDEKSGDYNPYYNGENNIFEEPLSHEEMISMGFSTGEYKNDGNGYYAWVYYNDIDTCQYQNKNTK